MTDTNSETLTYFAAQLIADRHEIHPAHALNRVKAAQRIIDDYASNMKCRIDLMDEQEITDVANSYGVSFDTANLAAWMVEIRRNFLDL